jgi:hypothetical protein
MSPPVRTFTPLSTGGLPSPCSFAIADEFLAVGAGIEPASMRVNSTPLTPCLLAHKNYFPPRPMRIISQTSATSYQSLSSRSRSSVLVTASSPKRVAWAAISACLLKFCRATSRLDRLCSLSIVHHFLGCVHQRLGVVERPQHDPQVVCVTSGIRFARVGG